MIMPIVVAISCSINCTSTRAIASDKRQVVQPKKQHKPKCKAKSCPLPKDKK